MSPISLWRGSARMWAGRRPGTRVTMQRDGERIRILYIINTLDVGGTEGQLVQLATRIDHRRFDVAVCCLGSPGPNVPPLEAAGVPVTPIGLRRASVWRPVDTARRLWRLLALVRVRRPHIVHGLLFHAYAIGSVLGSLASVPVVVASRRSLGQVGARAPYYRAIEWLANRLTSLVIANSDAVRERVLRQERLSPGQVAVIHNGIDTRVFEPPPEEQTRELRRALALDGRWPVVGVIANLIDYKGLQYFLPAWASVVDRHRKAVVLLVGDGPLRGSLETRVRALGLDDAARFLGNRADVPALLALMDLVVHPSLEEGFSNAILEAMAAGKPVVATAVGGTPEAVTDGVTGRLVPARDAGALAAAMLELLGSSDEPRRLGEAARRRVYEHFRVELMVRRHEQLYADALARHRGGAGSRVRTRAHRADS